jgi:hypothetical protein
MIRAAYFFTPSFFTPAIEAVEPPKNELSKGGVQ